MSLYLNLALSQTSIKNIFLKKGGYRSEQVTQKRRTNLILLLEPDLGSISPAVLVNCPFK